MQKKLKSALAIVSLVGALAIFFIACGDGVPIELNGEILESFETGKVVFDGTMKEKIDSIRDGTFIPPSSSSEPEPESSSSQPPRSSSSEPDEVSSSSRATQSSSSAQTQSSSSRAASSSSKSPSTGGGGNCEAYNPKSGVTCNWDGYKSGSILTPGTTMKPASFTLPSGCSSVAWNYAPNTTEIALEYDCEALPADGVKAIGSKNYVLFAKLTCDDGTHINACDPKDGWSSKKAPELDGECQWSKNPTTTARGAIPSGITITDTDNICGTTKSVVYKYADGTKDWPSTGILSEWKTWDKKQEETYDVVATLNCPAYAQTVTSACDPLKVTAGSDYIIECTGDWNAAACGGVGKNSATLKLDECVEINVLGLDKSHQAGVDLVMRCQAAGNENEASVSYTLSLNGGTGTKCTGSYSCNNTVSIGKTKLGDNEFGTLCLTQLAGKSSVKCDFGQ